MAGDVMKKVQPGDQLKIPAETFNTFIDAARAYRTGRQNLGVFSRPEPCDRNVVRIKNNSGADRDRFDVLGIDTPLFIYADNPTEFQNRPALKGVAPTLADQLGRVAVLLEPASAGAIARAVISGIVPCKVYVNINTAVPAWADIEAGTMNHLVAKSSGTARVLWRAAGTGEQWALVQLSTGPIIRRIELKTDLTPPANPEQTGENSSAADAYDLQWDGSNYAIDTVGGAFAVYDFKRRFRSKGRDTVASGKTGARGDAIWRPDRKKWEILSIQEVARRIKGTSPTGTSPTVTKSMSTFTLTFTGVCDGGQSPLTGGGTTLVVNNPGFCFDSGVTVYGEWDASIPGYRVYDGPCPANPAGC